MPEQFLGLLDSSMDMPVTQGSISNQERKDIAERISNMPSDVKSTFDIAMEVSAGDKSQPSMQGSA